MDIEIRASTFYCASLRTRRRLNFIIVIILYSYTFGVPFQHENRRGVGGWSSCANYPTVGNVNKGGMGDPSSRLHSSRLSVNTQPGRLIGPQRGCCAVRVMRSRRNSIPRTRMNQLLVASWFGIPREIFLSFFFQFFSLFPDRSCSGDVSLE